MVRNPGRPSAPVGPAPRNGGTPDAEVRARPRRRVFSAEQKLRILREADELKGTGGIGKMLRREGLYSSHLTDWRAERDRGELAGLAPKKRGRKARSDRARDEELARLTREIERLRCRLAQAEAIIAVQKKVASLLGVPLTEDEGSDS